MSAYEHQQRDDPLHDVQTVTLDPGQRAVISYELDDRGSRFFLPTLAVTKEPNSSYELELDGSRTFGPASIPPTDIDDDTETWRPPETFERTATVTVENLDDSVTRTYHVRLKGWERPPYSDEGGL